MRTNSFTESQLQEFQRTGHLTIDHLFDAPTIETVLDDLTTWSGQFVDTLDPGEKKWFLEGSDRNGKRCVNSITQLSIENHFASLRRTRL